MVIWPPSLSFFFEHAPATSPTASRTTNALITLDPLMHDPFRLGPRRRRPRPRLGSVPEVSPWYYERGKGTARFGCDRARLPSGLGLGDHRDHSVRFGYGQSNVGEVGQALAVDGGQEVLLGEQLGSERFLLKLPVVDEDLRPPFHQAFRPPAPEYDKGQGQVGGQENDRADEAPRDGVVVPDHGVLQDVGDGEQHDDVEPGELPELPPP